MAVDLPAHFGELQIFNNLFSQLVWMLRNESAMLTQTRWSIPSDALSSDEGSAVFGRQEEMN